MDWRILGEASSQNLGTKGSYRVHRIDFWDYWIAVNGQSLLYENRTGPTHAVLGMSAHLKNMPGRKDGEL